MSINANRSIGPPCYRTNAKMQCAPSGERARRSTNLNITSPDWHPELVMRCDLKSYERLLFLYSRIATDLYFNQAMKTSFFPLRSWLLYFVFCHSSSSYSILLMRAYINPDAWMLSCTNFTRCACAGAYVRVWGRCWMSNGTSKKNQFSFLFSFLRLESFNTKFLLHDFESENLQMYIRSRSRCVVSVCLLSTAPTNQEWQKKAPTFHCY